MAHGPQKGRHPCQPTAVAHDRSATRRPPWSGSDSRPATSTGRCVRPCARCRAVRRPAITPRRVPQPRRKRSSPPSRRPCSTGCRSAVASLASGHRRSPPRSPRWAAAESRAQHRSPARWPRCSSPILGSRATARVPAPPCRSTENADGPRRFGRALRVAPLCGRSFASSARPPSAFHRATEAQPALAHRWTECRSGSDLDSGKPACEIGSGRQALQAPPHPASAPRDPLYDPSG